jgi:sigma-B regulation protein RsbU (phosphoserine phosphatase)
MPVPTVRQIVYCAAEPAEDLLSLLGGAGYAPRFVDFDQAADVDLDQCDLFLVDSGRDIEPALHLCRQVRSRQGEHFMPLLMLTGDTSPRARLASLSSGADGYILHPFEHAELLAQVQTFADIKERHDHLLARSAEFSRVNKRLQAAYQQIDQELELARRIQDSFLPQCLPHLPEVRFAVKYRPCSRVGGDFYDVFRLDEQHLGFYVADAMGHGVPASLLAIFVKKGVKAKEIDGKDYRLVPPGEVLRKLNRDLIEQALSEQPFVTMVYALLDFRQGILRFARSGHPYPLYIPCQGPPTLWQVEGTLLGVFEADYPMQTHRLAPGDKVLFYTDGLDAGSFDNQPVGTASLLAAAGAFRHLPIEELVDRLATDLFGHTRQSDDLTVLGVEFGGGPAR